MRSTAAYADQRMGKPSNIKGGSLGNGRAIVFQKNMRELLRMAENGVSGKLTDIKINIECDVSETLTGLKAVQREAKEAARALKELESVQMKANATEWGDHGPLGTGMMVDASNWGKSNPGFANELVNYSNEELIKELQERGYTISKETYI